MARIISYLTFNGNCREAMRFYQECLGGELQLQMVSESPAAENLPEMMKSLVLQATLKSGPIVLMASDCVPDSGLFKGNAVSLMLNCDSEPEIRRIYRSLSAGGKVTHALESNFWNALFGDLTDRFGNNWLLNYKGKDY